jgi:hypothetical protein
MNLSSQGDSLPMYRELLLILFIVLLFVLGIIKQCGVIGIAAFLLRLSTVLLLNLVLASLSFLHALFQPFH